MRLLVGLGNPGPRYQGTRHNFGFEVVDRLARDASASWRAGPSCLVAETELAGVEVILAKPQAFMNRSGWVVAELAQAAHVAPNEVLILLDDVALPLGMLRIRPRGGDGGHRGLESVLRGLGSEEVPRLRLGIGPAQEPEDLSEFVLEPFAPEERKLVEEVIDRACAAVGTLLLDGIDKAMSLYNTTPCSSRGGRAEEP